MYVAAEQIVSLPKAGLQKLNHPLAEQFGIDVDVLRLDKIHPIISGNKFFKLRYFIEEAQQHDKGIVTFGGPWSNHLIATAYICRELKIACTGLVRGERPSELSDTLADCESLGMKLDFISRQDYAQKIIPASYQNNVVMVPEGGASITGVQGAATILSYLHPAEYTEIFCAIGTGTMMAGLLQQDSTPVHGISVLKIREEDQHNFESLVRQHMKNRNSIFDYGFHFGGYSKHSQELIKFMNELYGITGIPTDIVYTGKLFYGLIEIIKGGSISRGSKICMIHSGGLQGNRSLPPGTLVY